MTSETAGACPHCKRPYTIEWPTVDFGTKRMAQSVGELQRRMFGGRLPGNEYELDLLLAEVLKIKV